MPPTRLASLDQFRGATVLAMFAVNFVGGLAHVPAGLKHHHTYCSFADTIMPAFLFAVGFGMRLSFLRRREADGPAKAYRHFLGRCGGLILLGVLWYHLTGKHDTVADLTAKPLGEFLLAAVKRHPFETLTHIGVTTLWCLPVVAAAGRVRVLFAVASGGLHVWLSHLGYYQWTLTPPVGINGGPLGFLAWTIPLVLGTHAHDWTTTPNDPAEGPGQKVVAAGGLLMAAGYALSCLNRWTTPNVWTWTGDWRQDQLADWPFVPLSEPWQLNYWAMSLRAGSVPYTLFAGGVAVTAFAAFQLLCDRWGFRWGYLDLLGRHALAGYLVHDLAGETVKPFVPKDSPLGWVMIAFAVYLLLVTVVLRYLDHHRLFLKL